VADHTKWVVAGLFGTTTVAKPKLAIPPVEPASSSMRQDHSRVRLCFPFLFVLSAGISSVRCSWGGAQEAAALAQLSATFPDASVEEVCSP